MQRVLILGAGGQIGRAAIARFAADGWQVDAVSRSPLPEDLASMARTIQPEAFQVQIIAANDDRPLTVSVTLG